MKDGLARFENALRNLIERTLERVAGGRLDSASVAVQMVRAMESSLHEDEAGRYWAPDEYRLRLHPQELKALQEQHADLIPLLREAVLQAARGGEISIEEEPHIMLVADYKMARNKVRVEAIHSKDAQYRTRQMPSLRRERSMDVSRAMLVGARGEIYPLGGVEVNIGRLRDNQIVFDDPRVSRRHARIRLHEGFHVVHDLDSKAGTSVNGEPKTECMLRHGDVITIAGNRLVYHAEGLGRGRDSSASNPGEAS
jgi:hypothetical protein